MFAVCKRQWQSYQWYIQSVYGVCALRLCRLGYKGKNENEIKVNIFVQ